MENTQQELMRVLLGTVYNQGLLSKAAYVNAMDFVHSTLDIPPLFRNPVCLAEEVRQCEPT